MEALIDNRITDKNTAQAYSPVYEELFAPLRESCTALLEVGVFDGGVDEALERLLPQGQPVWI